MYPLSIKNLVEVISRLPSIGKRQAFRLVFYLIRHNEIRHELILKLNELNKNIKICPMFFTFDGAIIYVIL
jgi:recombinational DNA repair protein RecR